MRIFFALFLFFPLLAKANCLEKCARNDFSCEPIGLLGRASVLHLNEIMNAIQPDAPTRWPSSRCARLVTVRGAAVTSAGGACEEWSEPRPGYPATHEKGMRTLIGGDLVGTISGNQVFFDSAQAPDFSFVWQNEPQYGGRVLSLSRGEFGELVVETADRCFSVD